MHSYKRATSSAYTSMMDNCGFIADMTGDEHESGSTINGTGKGSPYFNAAIESDDV